jgi:competence protein ComFC
MENNNRCKTCQSNRSVPVFALGYYVDPMKEIIHQFKYYGFKKVGEYLAEEIINIHQKRFCELDIDFIVPIPLYSHRFKSRGFNQAEVLSNIIGTQLGIPVDSKSLVKIKKTRDQARLDPKNRQNNIKGAFKLFEDVLIDKKVVIVDDVITTGATVNEAYKVLKKAEVKPVAYCAIAIAGVD